MLGKIKTFQVSDDIEITYDIKLEKGSKPTLVFLHGIGGDLGAWNPEREIFDDLGYSTMAVDLLGHGLSSRPDREDAYTMENFASSVIDVLKHEKVSKPIVIGHCFGAAVALSIASNTKFPLQGLVLVDLGSRKPIITSIIPNKSLALKVLHMLGKVSSKDYKTERRNHSEFIGTSNIDIKRLFSDISHTSLYSWLSCSTAFIDSNLEQLLDSVNTPTLVVSGSDDRVFPSKTSEILADKIRHSHFTVIPDANHILVINNPESLSMEIEKFLAHHNM